MTDLMTSIGIARLVGTRAGIRACLRDGLRFRWLPRYRAERCACEAEA
ncbi:MAG TPA: hypothetical protein VLN26_12955 [Gaiellaceae bacterium]|nr:hypothetical protein [Gaiellaceae bacterium]